MFEILFFLMMGLFILVSLVLILIILIQKGRGGGLASAFGGMGGNTAFGAKTGDVLTWATSIIFGVFLLLAVALNLAANQRHADRVRLPEVEPPTSTTPQRPAPTPPSGSLPGGAPLEAPSP
jgi:preprotein translocase subunit SecG